MREKYWKRVLAVALVSTLAFTLLNISTPVSATGGVSYSETSDTTSYNYFDYEWTDYRVVSGIGDGRHIGMQFRELYGEHQYASTSAFGYYFEHYFGNAPEFPELNVTSDLFISMDANVSISEVVGGEVLVTEEIDLLGGLSNSSTLQANPYDALGQARNLTVYENSDGSYSFEYVTTIVEDMLDDPIGNLDYVGTELSLFVRVFECPEDSGDPVVYLVSFGANITSSDILLLDFGLQIQKGEADDVVEQKIDTLGGVSYAEYRYNGNEYFSVIPSGYFLLDPHEFNQEEFFSSHLPADVSGLDNQFLEYPAMLLVPQGVHSSVDEDSWTDDYYGPTRTQISKYLQEPSIDVRLDGDYGVSGVVERGDTVGYNLTLEHNVENFLLDAKASLRMDRNAEGEEVDVDLDGLPDLVYDGDVPLEDYYPLKDVDATSATVSGEFTIPTTVDDGFYIILVEGFDKAGHYVVMESADIVIGDMAPNVPPQASISVISDEVVYDEPTEFVLIIQDEGQSVKYKVYWGDGLWESETGMDEGYLVASDYQPVPNSNFNQFNIYLNHTYSGFDVYEIKVYTEDNQGASGQIRTLDVVTVQNEEQQLADLASEGVNVLWGFLVILGLFVLINRVADSIEDLADEKREFAQTKREYMEQGIWDIETQTRHYYKYLKMLARPTKLGWFFVVIIVGLIYAVYVHLSSPPSSGLFMETLLTIMIDNTLLYMKVFSYAVSEALWGIFDYNSMLSLIGTLAFGFMMANSFLSFKGGRVSRRF